MDSLGISFVPGADQAATRPAGLTPTQTAVQLLSMRLPRRPSVQGIAPQPLLQSPGGTGVQGTRTLDTAMANPLLQALLRLAGITAPQQVPQRPGEVAQMPGGEAGGGQSPGLFGDPAIPAWSPKAPKIIPGEDQPRLATDLPSAPSLSPFKPPPRSNKGPLLRG